MKTRKMKGGLYVKERGSWRIEFPKVVPPIEVKEYREKEVKVLNELAKKCGGKYRDCISDTAGRLAELKPLITHIRGIGTADPYTWLSEYQKLKLIVDNLEKVITLRDGIDKTYQDPDNHSIVTTSLTRLHEEITHEIKDLVTHAAIANKQVEDDKKKRHEEKLEKKHKAELAAEDTKYKTLNQFTQVISSFKKNNKLMRAIDDLEKLKISGQKLNDDQIGKLDRKQDVEAILNQCKTFLYEIGYDESMPPRDNTGNVVSLEDRVQSIDKKIIYKVERTEGNLIFVSQEGGADAEIIHIPSTNLLLLPKPLDSTGKLIKVTDKVMFHATPYTVKKIQGNLISVNEDKFIIFTSSECTLISSGGKKRTRRRRTSKIR